MDLNGKRSDLKTLRQWADQIGGDCQVELHLIATGYSEMIIALEAMVGALDKTAKALGNESLMARKDEIENLKKRLEYLTSGYTGLGGSERTEPNMWAV